MYRISVYNGLLLHMSDFGPLDQFIMSTSSHIVNGREHASSPSIVRGHGFLRVPLE